MEIIFELEKECNDSTFQEINSELEKEDSSYIESFGKVGSKLWWENYKEGKLEVLNLFGPVLSIFTNEEDGITETFANVETDKSVVEIGVTSQVKVGDVLDIDTITICPNLDKPENSYQFLLKICINT